MVEKSYKSYNISFKNIAKQPTFRPDLKYRRFWDFENGILYHAKTHVRLDSIISELIISKIKKGNLDEPQYLINISDQDPGNVLLDELEEVDEVGSAKNPLSNADIIISKLGLPKGYLFYNNKKEYKKLLGSSELIPYVIRNKESNPKFLAYFLTLPSVLKKYHNLESGKTPSHWRVNPFDILKTYIPEVDYNIQNEAIKRITLLEKQIRSLKRDKKQSLEILNEVFAEIYGYSKTLWLEFGKSMTAGTQKSQVKSFNWYSCPYTNISNNNILRFSTRFHNPLTKQLTKILSSKPTLKLGGVVEQEIKRGIQPKADDNGEYYVIKTGQLKNNYIDVLEADMVTSEFYDSHTSAQTHLGDVLIASTGKVSLGKVDVYEFEEDAVVDGHVSIIRLNEEKYNKLFLAFFLRSLLGAFQIERDYTGATNQIELYPEQISMFLIPDIKLDEQEKIVEEIKLQLDGQKEIKQKIEKNRQHINRIIEEAINK